MEGEKGGRNLIFCLVAGYSYISCLYFVLVRTFGLLTNGVRFLRGVVQQRLPH